MKVLTFLLSLLSIPLFSQSSITYSYDGKPGAIVEYSIPTTPNSVYQFDFCAMNVPDRLTIATPNSNISFYIGTNITDAEISSHDDYYRGYVEAEFSDYLTLIKNQYPNPPPDFSCTNLPVYRPTEGTLRLTYTTTQCNLSFKVEGNKEDRTVYNLIVTKLEEGYQSTNDTLIVPSCTPKPSSWVSTNCGLKYYIYNDYGIYANPLITNPSCIGSLDGSITFYNYPQYNLYNIPTGNYPITISNNVCTKEFNITLQADTLCNIYIPNVFHSPQDNFIMYSEEDTPYWLRIFDRWGNLVLDRHCVTNLSGWDGANHQPGVYAYVIYYFDKVFYGDITLIK